MAGLLLLGGKKKKKKEEVLIIKRCSLTRVKLTALYKYLMTKKPHINIHFKHTKS